VTTYRTFDGLTIPSAVRFGWFFGIDRWLDGEFFRYEITKLQPILSPAAVGFVASARLALAPVVTRDGIADARSQRDLGAGRMPQEYE
jgi:hypothetical protein